MATTVLNWPFKDPDEVLDYWVNWVDRLDGDTINSSTWTKVSGSVTVDSDDFTSSLTSIWLSGGTLGETCEFLNHITTVGGRTMEQTIKLKIKKR